MSSQAATAAASARPPPCGFGACRTRICATRWFSCAWTTTASSAARWPDAFRVDATVATLYTIVERGGRPILITHVGRPFDPKARRISCSDDESVIPVRALPLAQARRHVRRARFPRRPDEGILDVDTSVNWLVEDLKNRRVGGVYLPNARWFAGEEGLVAGPDADETALARDRFATQLAGLADVFVNDAFGSWQPHVSTLGVAKLLPSYAGLLMQRECDALRALIEPKRPFVAVLAGSKLDTKIGTVRAVAERCDALLLGGVLYNAYVAAKRGVDVEGVSEGDVELAREFYSTTRSSRSSSRSRRWWSRIRRTGAGASCGRAGARRRATRARACAACASGICGAGSRGGTFWTSPGVRSRRRRCARRSRTPRPSSSTR